MSTATYRLALSSAAVDDDISAGVVTFGTHCISATLNATIFSEAASNGSDVWFSSDVMGNSAIDADIFYWDDSGEVFGVKIAAGALSSSAGATIYMQIGDKPGGYGTDPYPAAQALEAPLAEDFNDRTSNSNNGTALGGISAGGATGPTGAIPATQFDGTDDRVGIPNVIQGNMDATGQLWMKHEPSGPVGDQLPFGTSAASRFYMFLQGSTKHLQARIGTDVAFGAFDVPDNTYIHAAVAYDHSEGDGFLIVNGSQVASDTSSSLTVTPSLQTIGAFQQGTTFNFKGELAFVKAFTSVRTAAEIKLDYLLEGPNASTYWSVLAVGGSRTRTRKRVRGRHH